MNNSTVTIPLLEYKLMEKRIERKKDEVIYFSWYNYYWTIQTRKLVADMQHNFQDDKEAIRSKFSAQVQAIESNYKKAISLYRLAIWVLVATIIVILLI